MVVANDGNPESLTGRSALGLREQLWVLAFALLASLTAIWWSWAHGAFLLYGDAEAHIHIARRIFDSHRPGLGQLGSVWLPLPHLLLAPFVAVGPWWRSGFAGVIPSAGCYVLACLGLYRLARKWVSPLAAGFGAAFFGLNPNLLYLQTTAMTEPLFLCLLIWAVLLLVEWHAGLDAPGEGRRLWLVIAVLVAAVWTRYDGWILAFLAWGAMAVCLWRRGRLVRREFVLASVVLLAAPVAWMAYNAALFGDWLDFMRGPYSAKAIEERTSGGAVPPHPGWHDPWVSTLFFLKAAQLDSFAMAWFWLLTTIQMSSVVFLKWSGPRMKSAFLEKTAGGRTGWTLFLWLPLPFYAYSVSFGSVPIFLPVWWPHSYYNARYGMELLPALGIFAALAAQTIWNDVIMRWRWSGARPRVWMAGCVLGILIGLNVLWLLRDGPLVFVEGEKNAEARGYYNRAIPEALGRLHAADPSGLVLMDTSAFPSIVPHAGLTYAETLNESDKEFFAEALGAPAEHASIVLAFAGDAVDGAVKLRPEGLRVVERFQSQGQPDATLYVRSADGSRF